MFQLELESNHGWDSQELAVDEQRQQSEVSTTAVDKKHQCLGFIVQPKSGCSTLTNARYMHFYI